MNPNYYFHPIDVGFNAYYVWAPLSLLGLALLGQLRYRRARSGRIAVGGVPAAAARALAAFFAVLFAFGGVLKESHTGLIQVAYNWGLVGGTGRFIFLVIATGVSGAVFYLVALAAIRTSARLRYQHLKRDIRKREATASIGARQPEPAVRIVPDGRPAEDRRTG